MMYGAETWTVFLAQGLEDGRGRSRDVEMDVWYYRDGQNKE